ncbi:MAG: STAS domain-containing protein [Gammaproteobacteria bacterium]|nr:STAS domain-containing protein [Gammaproteobacteria bacterium]
MRFSITVDDIAHSTARMHISGQLDNSTAPLLEQRLDETLAKDVSYLVFDLQDLSYISSAGLRSIFKTKKNLAKVQGKVLICNMQPQVKKVFEIINALPSFSVFSSYQEMDDYLATIQHREMEK